MAQWRTVDLHGKPANGDYFGHVNRGEPIPYPVYRVNDGNYAPGDVWMPKDEFEALLPAIDDIAPAPAAPLPVPWRPMEELLDGHRFDVWVATNTSEHVGRYCGTSRDLDVEYGRLAWAPIVEGYPAPTHPFELGYTL